jgi:glucose/arabinose dehydrogenase
MKTMHTYCAAVIALLMAQPLGAAPIFAESVHRCPPSHTNTIPSPENPGVVLVEGHDLVAVRLTSDFELPWSLAFLPDGSFLVTERPGRLQHVRFGSEVHEVTGTPAVLYDKHGGLLDIAVDPKFAENGLVYMSYLQGERSASTMRVMKARYDLPNETLSDQQVIFEGTPGPTTDQIGGRIALTEDGYLFLTLGDRWDRSLPQDLSTHAGTIIRVKTDGSVPADNPFVTRVDAKNEIWSYGHRNPQGLALDRATGQLWAIEHGPRGGDELNIIQRAHNYGWPLATYGTEDDDSPIGAKEVPGTDQPIHYWLPLSVAPSGLAVETTASGTTIWIGSLGRQMVIKLTLAGNCVVAENHFLKDQLGRIRDIRIDPNGAVYILPEGGALYRLERSLDDDSGPDKRRL